MHKVESVLEKETYKFSKTLRYKQITKNIKEIAEKTVEHESDGDTNGSWCTWNSSLGFGVEIRGIGH